MEDFNKWDREFRTQNMFAFNHDRKGLLWLKVRAVCRGKQIEQFCLENGIELKTSRMSDKNVELFNILENRTDGMRMLDSFLCVQSHNWYDSLGVDEEKLKEDLYKVQYYAWGGDQNNSLDKYLVSHYVKSVSNYDELFSRQGEIALNAWNYVQTSWYNNWTSYLIESIFKRHPKVISAVGEIKSVDFFIENEPIDLKVTYFPNQYMDMKLKEKIGKKELAWLKAKARTVSISVDDSQTDSQQLYTLTEKLQETGYDNIVGEIRKVKAEIVEEAQDNVYGLIEWLYENQGEMRFGSENRIFVILVDSRNMADSWKMKRALNLIEPKITNYLDNYSSSSLKEINFTFKKNRYKSLADAIFVIK